MEFSVLPAPHILVGFPTRYTAAALTASRQFTARELRQKLGDAYGRVA